MVQKFKNDTWYKFDFLLNFDNQTVTVYIDGEQKASDIFFSDPNKGKITYSDTVILYNLTPEATCKMKNLKIC